MKITNVCGVQNIKNEGDFCIETVGEQLPTFIQYCPKLGTCPVKISKNPPANGVWWWDGNYETPTIRPSIGCEGRGIGCTKHITITNGETS